MISIENDIVIGITYNGVAYCLKGETMYGLCMEYNFEDTRLSKDVSRKIDNTMTKGGKGHWCTKHYTEN